MVRSASISRSAGSFSAMVDLLFRLRVAFLDLNVGDARERNDRLARHPRHDDVCCRKALRDADGDAFLSVAHVGDEHARVVSRAREKRLANLFGRHRRHRTGMSVTGIQSSQEHGAAKSATMRTTPATRSTRQNASTILSFTRRESRVQLELGREADGLRRSTPTTLETRSSPRARIGRDGERAGLIEFRVLW